MPANCSFCLEPTGTFISVSDTESVCHGCIDDYIVPQFHQALDHEVHYPVVVGSTRIEPDQFIDWLGSTFIQRWARRKEEFECNNRIYCPHTIEKAQELPVGEVTNTPLALSDAQQADCISQRIPTTPCGGFVAKKTDEVAVTACKRCRGYVATCCGAAVWGASSTHNCKSQESDPLAGQIRGKHYQICPSCTRKYQLSSGCNHMQCPCGGQFCYVCGKPSTANSGHWNTGSTCPRWNHPDSDNAQFDTPLNDDFLEENFGGENGLPFARLLITDDGFDEEIIVGFAHFQQTTREHLDRLAEEGESTPEHPLFLTEVLRPDMEAGFDLRRPNSSLTQLAPSGIFNIHNEPNFQLELDLVKMDIEFFFDTRAELLNEIVEAMMPRPRHVGPTPDEDIVINITPNLGMPGRPAMRHEHMFSVELHLIVRFLGIWLMSQDRDLPVTGPLLPMAEVMLITFSGEYRFDQVARIDNVYFEPVEQNDERDVQQVRETNAFLDALNDELYMYADQLVRDILRHFHDPDWTIGDEAMDLSD